MIHRIIITTALLAGFGCGSDSSTAAAEKPDDVIEAWRTAGLEVGEHAPLAEHVLGEAECVRGEVAKVETTVCSYATDDAAKQAQNAGLGMVGSTTGASLARGKLLLVVADRGSHDKDGKAINALTKSFLGR
jgi:hypothetical protein